MSVNNMSAGSSPRNSKIFLLGFFLCCSMPLVAAKFALEFSWFNAGVGSRGQWLESEIHLLPQVKHSQQHWRLVYVQAQECDAGCELALYTMQQLYLGLTGQQERIGLAIIADTIPQYLESSPAIAWQLANLRADHLQNQIFIVDRQGMAILRYTPKPNPQQMLQLSRDIRKDLRRLLAFDRGGA